MTTSDQPTGSMDDRAGAAVRLLQMRAPEILNAVDDGVICLDARGAVMFTNEAAARILGFTNREMLGRSLHELTHHHYADGSVFPVEECPIDASVSDGIQQRVGGDTFWRKDGTALPVDFTSIPIREGRTIVGVVVTFRDISDQQRVEEQALRLRREREALRAADQAREALRESEERYRFMAEALPVMVWTSAPDGKLDFVTDRVATYFGLSKERILRDGWQDVVHPEDLPGVAAQWMHCLETGTPYKVEFRLRTADGSYRRHLARALPQRDPDGRIVRWFGTNMDVEEERRVVT
jgi:PAS domain S-box-containing protein